MNIMLVAVTVVSFAIGEVSTGIIVALLIAAERRARHAPGAEGAGERRRAVEDAGAAGQGACATDRSRWCRRSTSSPATSSQLEAGDIVPADGRIVRSATLETQEAALTGESAPVAKDAAVLPGGDVALGDRTNMLFQNTSVTRGTAAMVVTATGMEHPDGPDRDDADLGRRARGRRCRRSSTR